MVRETHPRYNPCLGWSYMHRPPMSAENSWDYPQEYMSARPGTSPRATSDRTSGPEIQLPFRSRQRQGTSSHLLRSADNGGVILLVSECPGPQPTGHAASGSCHTENRIHMKPPEVSLKIYPNFSSFPGDPRSSPLTSLIISFYHPWTSASCPPSEWNFVSLGLAWLGFLPKHLQ